jgi:molybdopterin-guanine dinucleotide biosynthesis protein A
MGGRDKALLLLGGETLAARALRRLGAQLREVVLSSNADPAGLGLPGGAVLRDLAPDRRGPLAGVEAGLIHAGARRLPGVVTVAVDTPFFPDDLAGRLIGASAGMSRVVVAADDGGLHPTFAFWPLASLGAVSAALQAGDYRLGRLAEEALGAARAGFAGGAFFNINTPEDLVEAEVRAARE